jgi:parvulin-like peptidyl-prolyl isomerase
MRFQAPDIKRQVIMFLVFFLFLTGCDKINFFKPKKAESRREGPTVAIKGTVIARVSNIPVTLEQLKRDIDIYNASLDLRTDLADAQKKELKIDTREKQLGYLKDVLVRQRVFYQAALDRGLDRKDNIIAILEEDKIAILGRAMEDEIIKNIDVSSTEIQQAYENSKALFKEPETRKVRVIVTKTEDEARQILIELLQGSGDFASIARTRSIAESAKNGGDLGSIKKGEGVLKFPAFDEIAFSAALQQGSVSNVFKGPDGYYIVKIDEVKEGKQFSLTEAWDTLKQLLLARKQQDELDKIYSQLSRGVKIEVYEGEIK